MVTMRRGQLRPKHVSLHCLLGYVCSSHPAADTMETYSTHIPARNDFAFYLYHLVYVFTVFFLKFLFQRFLHTGERD